MAAGAAARSIRAPGRLIVAPLGQEFADFNGGTYPYRGREIGKVRSCVAMPQGSAYFVESEATGAVTDVLESGQRWVFACFLRGWDDDAIALFRPGGYTTGAITQHAVFSAPDEVPGSSALSRAVKLAFIPDDPVNVPGVIIYRAVPNWSDGAELALQRDEELGLPMTFECLRDSTGRILQIGRIHDLAVT